MKPYCEKCNHTGLVPSKALGKFSGKPIPNCFSDCECKGDSHDYDYPLKPEDFDFPMSSTFRAFSFQYCGWPDPGYIPPEAQPNSPKEVIHSHSDIGKKEFALLQKVDYLEKRLKERSDKKDIKYVIK